VSACVDSFPEADNPTASGRIRRSTIEETAEDRLRRSGYLALRDIACAVREGVACLQGRLPTYYLKQVAQAIVAEVDGVIVVSNQIEVLPSAQASPIGRGDGSRRSATVPAEHQTLSCLANKS
jgi:osmotically-inducible protein OsmY